MNKVELLAPAGNFDCLKAAINNGANAVYLGGKNFSARAFANNFNEDEIIEAVKYAHLKNVKIYVTLNTLLNEDEFNNAIKMVEFYYRNNVDALLIQDLGLYYYIKNNYPDFELHCSTQMHIHNIDGIKTAKKLGFKRVVVARESSLDFIKEACKQDIEIETFVHGALCVSYSGQCLMSSVTKNRSANKGMCAQSCRLKYSLYDTDNKKVNTKTEYLLSPSDLCLIDDIPSLIEAGVSSFKIEGRLKSPAYVGYVTRMYRKAIDSYYNNKIFKLSKNELNNLKVLFNREFNNSYLYSKNNVFGQNTPNHLGIEIGEAFKYSDGKTYIKLNYPLKQFDGIRINEYGCIVNKLYKNNLLVNGANINDIVAIETDSKMLGKVYKTLDYLLENEILQTKESKHKIDLDISINANSPIKVIFKFENIEYEYLSDINALEAKNQPLTVDDVIRSFTKINETIYEINKIDVDTNNAFLRIKELNQIRRDAFIKFDEYRLSLFKRSNIYPTIDQYTINYNESNEIVIENDVCKYNNEEYSINYTINPESKYSDSNNALICEIGGILKTYKSKIAYYTLNCSNSYCYEFLKNIGFGPIILSSELNEHDKLMIIKNYKERNNLDIKPYTLKQGNRVLMYIKANPFDSYIDQRKQKCIKDINNTYLIKHNNGITEILECKETNINKQSFTIN